jgi:hypothetical protein
VRSADGKIDCGHRCRATSAPGTIVVLHATANADWTFAGWQGDCVGVARSCAVAIDGTTAVRAVYERRRTSLSITVGGPGTVRSVPRGLACGGGARACTHTFGLGTTVRLRAVALHGGVFGGWQGPCTGTGGCAVPMTRPRTVTAAFGVTGGNGTIATASPRGRVVSVPAGLDCRNAACNSTFAPGTLVVLHATVPFHDWIGACAGPVPTCPLVAGGPLPPAGARFPSAHFKPPQVPPAAGFKVFVTVAGDGRVGGHARGRRISCGRRGATLCTAVFPLGAFVFLQAVAGPSSHFAGWSGRCSGTGFCAPTSTLEKSFVVRATFKH